MFKKFLTITVLSIFMLCTTTLAEPLTYSILNEDYKKAVNAVTDTYTMYTTTVVNVRTMPSTDSEIVITYNRNTQVDCLFDKDGWTTFMVDGDFEHYFFIKSDYLSEKETPYTEDDLWWLAHVICGEMQCESYEDQLYTGSVVLNRVNSSAWSPNHSLEEVITDKRWGIQYACYYDGNFFREPTATNWEVARYLLECGSQIPADVVFQSSRKQGKGVWKHTKGAYYCYGNI